MTRCLQLKTKQYFFQTKYLHVLHQNIAGLLSKSDFLMINLEELLDRGIFTDVLCITEHFMMAGYESFLDISNYTLAECYSRNNSKRGGACILVKKEHNWKNIPEVKNITLKNVFECCAIELTDYKIVIICFYRVPSPDNLNVFFNKLEKVLMVVSKIKSIYI